MSCHNWFVVSFFFLFFVIEVKFSEIVFEKCVVSEMQEHSNLFTKALEVVGTEAQSGVDWNHFCHENWMFIPLSLEQGLYSNILRKWDLWWFENNFFFFLMRIWHLFLYLKKTVFFLTLRISFFFFFLIILKKLPFGFFLPVIMRKCITLSSDKIMNLLL